MQLNCKFLEQGWTRLFFFFFRVSKIALSREATFLVRATVTSLGSIHPTKSCSRNEEAIEVLRNNTVENPRAVPLHLHLRTLSRQNLASISWISFYALQKATSLTSSDCSSEIPRPEYLVERMIYPGKNTRKHRFKTKPQRIYETTCNEKKTAS